MITEIKMYECKCDHCGISSSYLGEDLSGLDRVLNATNWRIVKSQDGEKEKHFCPECWKGETNKKNIIYAN